MQQQYEDRRKEARTTLANLREGHAVDTEALLDFLQSFSSEDDRIASSANQKIRQECIITRKPYYPTPVTFPSYLPEKEFFQLPESVREEISAYLNGDTPTRDECFTDLLLKESGYQDWTHYCVYRALEHAEVLRSR
jgi:hypothetical protein